MDASLDTMEGRPPCRPSFRARKADETEPVPPGRRSESAIHLALTRLAFLWAQENGYPVAGFTPVSTFGTITATANAYNPRIIQFAARLKF